MKDAVVTLGEKKLLISPYKNGPVLTNIPEGTEVWVDDAYQDYIYVHLENDIAGWIEKEAIMKIRP